MKTRITIDVDTDALDNLSNTYLAALWHAAQANPAHIKEREAGAIAECIGREIIRRFLADTPPELWAHQGGHADWYALHIAREATVAAHG